MRINLIAGFALVLYLSWLPCASCEEASIFPGYYVMEVMPDTVDLTRSANLALNAITRCTNSEHGYSFYFLGNITQNPVRLAGNAPDSVAQWKLTEPLLLLRTMTGNRANLEVDRAWATSLSKLLDRLPETHPVYIGRGLAAVSVLYSLTGDSQWRYLGIRIVDRLDQFCGRHDDFAYFPVTTAFLADPTQTVPLDEYHEPFPTGWPAMHDAWLVEGLVAFYEQTDYQPALTLAGQLVKHMRFHGKIFTEDGQFIAAHNGYQGPRTALHFHRHTNVLLAMLDYAIASREMDYAHFAQKGYEYATRQGNARIGFFPEYLPDAFPDDRHGTIDCEGCCVADMTLLALRLSVSGVGDYWEDVDRYVRNMLTQMQLKGSANITKQVEELPPSPVDQESEDSFQAAERLVGSFAGWSGPNEFRVCGPGVMQCCTANCGRALYFVWHQMLTSRQDILQIDLLLNRVADEAVVKSFLPCAGHVQIVLKKDVRLRVRMPPWVDRSTVEVRNSLGQGMEHFFDGCYLTTDPLSSGEIVNLRFDLPERETTEKVGHLKAEVRFRGHEVVQFSPRGKNIPYWRDKDVDVPACPESATSYFVSSSEYEPFKLGSDQESDFPN